jgi:E3 ubiquitin-protein ligase ZSWIM2
MLLVQTVGPTVFVVKEDGSETKYKVIVGSKQMCTCRQSSSGSSLCVHILFVMLKVLRVPRENPVLWQLSLTDNEVDQVLAGSLGRRREVVTHHFMKRKGKSESKSDAKSDPGVTQQVLQEDENCPICMDEMKPDDPLTYCKKQCGNNIHIECALEYAQHKVSSRDKISCPLCRVDWGSMAIYELKQADKDFKSGKTKMAGGGCGTAGSTTHKGTCAVCQCSPIPGPRHRCVQCVKYDLCAPCFGRGLHSHHVFVRKVLPASGWEPAVRAPSRSSLLASGTPVVDPALAARIQVS